jgi:hypothetical protein
LKSTSLTKEQEAILLNTLLKVFGIYLSLNSVEEWPEYFEETFDVWGVVLNDWLLNNETQNPEILVKVKKVAIDIVRTLCFRLGEHFPPKYVEPYFQAIWKLLPLFPSSREFNKIVQSLINYIQDCLGSPELQKLIYQELPFLYDHLILKHLSFTSEDLEEFDSDEDAFIQMDLEENDNETRRRACFNLVRKLS